MKDLAVSLTKILQDALRMAGRPAGGRRRNFKAWWDDGCKDAHENLTAIRIAADNPTCFKAQTAWSMV